MPNIVKLVLKPRKRGSTTPGYPHEDERQSGELPTVPEPIHRM